MARASNTLLNKSVESGHFCLVLDFRGKAFSFSSLSMMLAVILSYMAAIMLSMFPSYLLCWKVFVIWMLNFVKYFLCICCGDYMLFTFHFVNVMFHIDLQMLNQPCITGINPTWPGYMMLLMYYWIQLANFSPILWEIIDIHHWISFRHRAWGFDLHILWMITTIDSANIHLLT